ncbi:hypothetical protein RU92_GL000607 [Lactococcus cremoris subsp. tructae]|uniref:Uncharacterized protein n=1 Tax=Lactococcus cremoris subsp. tructae TaxID=542833 RepID=A0A2A5SYE6_LACLC|nr:hypothetical protein RU92_GL000607 [Lactococcus cremoris subsp. tructae]
MSIVFDIYSLYSNKKLIKFVIFAHIIFINRNIKNKCHLAFLDTKKPL